MATPRDIHERAFEFGVRVIYLVDRLPRTIAGSTIGQQLIRSGTSVGANLREADGAESKRDFIHKVGVALKEAKEAHYWLRLAGVTLLDKDDDARALTLEAHELTLILAAIRNSAGRSNRHKPDASR